MATNTEDFEVMEAMLSYIAVASRRLHQDITIKASEWRAEGLTILVEYFKSSADLEDKSSRINELDKAMSQFGKQLEIADSELETAAADHARRIYRLASNMLTKLPDEYCLRLAYKCECKDNSSAEFTDLTCQRCYGSGWALKAEVDEFN